MRVMEHIGSDEMLLFSTDYPHWQFDGRTPCRRGLTPALAQKIMADNPLRTYPRLQRRRCPEETVHERGRPEPLRRAAGRRFQGSASPIATSIRGRPASASAG